MLWNCEICKEDVPQLRAETGRLIRPKPHSSTLAYQRPTIILAMCAICSQSMTTSLLLGLC